MNIHDRHLKDAVASLLFFTALALTGVAYDYLCSRHPVRWIVLTVIAMLSGLWTGWQWLARRVVINTEKDVTATTFEGQRHFHSKGRLLFAIALTIGFGVAIVEFAVRQRPCGLSLAMISSMLLLSCVVLKCSSQFHREHRISDCWVFLTFMLLFSTIALWDDDIAQCLW